MLPRRGVTCKSKARIKCLHSLLAYRFFRADMMLLGLGGNMTRKSSKIAKATPSPSRYSAILAEVIDLLEALAARHRGPSIR